jgi:hypothetical protein
VQYFGIVSQHPKRAGVIEDEAKLIAARARRDCGRETARLLEIRTLKMGKDMQFLCGRYA